MENSDIKKINHWSKDLRGVFTISDLKVLFATDSEKSIFKKIAVMIKEKVLIKVKQGLYAIPEAQLIDLSKRINPSAYVSMGSILAEKLIIGSIPARKLQAVKIGRPRVFVTSLGTIEHLSLAPKLFFGFNESEGLKKATPEKAFLDCCYFFYKGRELSFDLDTDVNHNLLDQKIIAEYLTKYDQRFITFYKKKWSK